MDNSLSLNELNEIKNNIELALDKIDKLYKKELEKLDEIEREDPSDEWWTMWDEIEEDIRSSVDTKEYHIEYQHNAKDLSPSSFYYFGQHNYEWCPFEGQMIVTNYLNIQDKIIKLQIKQLQKEE